MQKNERDSIYELFTLEFVRNMVKQIPLVYRRDLAAVSKDFYNVVVEMDAFKYKMKLSSELLKDQSTLSSILNSGRIFDQLEIDLKLIDKLDMDKLNAITEEHGSTIKQITMNIDIDDDYSDYKVDADDLIKFFENLPNLNDWTIRAYYDIFDDVVGKCKPVLKNLRSFTVYDILNNQLFEKLSSFIASDTIESLYIDDEIDCERFISRQRNLKSVKFGYIDFGQYLSLTRNLKLEEVRVSVYFNDRNNGEVHAVNNGLPQLLRAQESLKKITFFDFSLSAPVVELICQLPRFLRSLSLKLSNDNAASLLEIYKLKELQELTMNIPEGFWRADLLTELTRLEIPGIKKVEFFKSTNTVIDFDPIAENLGNHWKNIEELKVVNFKVRSINSILYNLRNLKSLSVGKCGSEPVLDYDGCSYPLIERLEIFDYYTDSDCNLPIHLLAAFPNLRYLHVNKCRYEGATQINFLKGMPKLRKLDMNFLVNSSKALPTLDDVLAIKMLCRSTKEFYISFSTPLDSIFTQELATLLENESDVQTLRHDYEKVYLGLKNLKF